MGTATISRPRTVTATPERWQKALQRALDGGVQIRRLAASGLVIATSASKPDTAYELTVTGDVVHGCSCPAGEFGDAVCVHRAAFWHAVGMLDLDAPEPPTPAAPVLWPGEGDLPALDDTASLAAYAAECETHRRADDFAAYLEKMADERGDEPIDEDGIAWFLSAA